MKAERSAVALFGNRLELQMLRLLKILEIYILNETRTQTSTLVMLIIVLAG